METRDYSKFKFHPANRPISNQAVNNLMMSIRDYGFIQGRDILVNGEFMIIDGQHRFVALKNLGQPIRYQVVQGDAIQTAVVLNANQRGWSVWNYIESYAERNMDCYRKMVKFEEKHKMGASNTMALVNNSSKFTAKDYRSGKVFEVNPRADEILEWTLSLNVPYKKRKDFTRAVVKLFRKATPDQLDILKMYMITIPECPTTGDYITAFENLLNGKKRTNKISLDD